MKLITYTGETPSEALKQIETDWGEEALVVSSKEIRKKTLGQSAIYEIVVGIEDAVAAAKVKSKSASAKPTNNGSDKNDDVLVEISSAAKEIEKIMKMAGLADEPKKPKPAAATETPKTTAYEPTKTAIDPSLVKEQAADLKMINKEIAKLADRVELIQNAIWSSVVDPKSLIPPEFAEIYRVSRQSGMSAEHFDAIMRQTLKEMPLYMRQSGETVRRYFKMLLRKMIPIRVESRLSRPNKKVMMLVGPTGVGKTTSLAKLAARYAHKSAEQYKVGIITVDTYRIGAVEQLSYYAKMMRLGIETVRDPIDFGAALSSLRHCDIILIDTAGSSQRDREKIAYIQQCLDAEKQTKIDVSLVMSVTSKLDDLRDIYKNYSSLGVDTIIATKFDETSSLGSFFSFTYERQKPLSYLSVGQEVPDDLIAANGDYFISCLFDGFNKPQAVAI
ncbi:MAG: flagellar biosynthesis protein FlhF [Helicobacteraceae bacterium]|jgi:flagellar biosynthesis protein FlhF|nr:flagellar biosynthesis protein FlhF [Helicobacteraceae bacterium]